MADVGGKGLLILIGMMSVLSASVSAKAEGDRTSTGTPSSFDLARFAFEDGLERLDAKDYEAAISLFDRSVALRESPAALYNLALACRGAGEYRRAMACFERFLLLSGERVEGAKAAKALVKEMRSLLVPVTVHVSGGAERVEVDGEMIAGADGAYEVLLDPGEHVFEAFRSGHEPDRQELPLASPERAEVPLDLSSAPAQAHLSIEGDTDREDVFVDGRRIGRGGRTLSLSPGVHDIEACARGKTACVRRGIVLEPGENKDLSFKHVPLEEPALLERWWFWAGMWAIVLTVATCAALVASGGDLDGGTLGFTIEGLRR